MYERMKNFPAAEAEFRKVLEMNPDNDAALNYLGYMLADRNIRLEEARDMIAKPWRTEPNNGAYLDSLGWVYFRLNKLPEAEDKLREALRYMSRDPTVHDHLAEVYFKEGKIRDAIAQWQSSVAGVSIRPAQRHGSRRSRQSAEEAGRRQGSPGSRNRRGSQTAVRALPSAEAALSAAAFRCFPRVCVPRRTHRSSIPM